MGPLNVMYARISKLVDVPCLHSEWRISGAGNIKRLTGISTIEDCIDFDKKQFYERITSRYIFHAEINQDRLGKFLNGDDGRKKNLCDERLLAIRVSASIFMGFYGISSTAHLVDTIKKRKKEIESHCGRRNMLQKRILALKSNRMFIDPISIE